MCEFIEAHYTACGCKRSDLIEQCGWFTSKKYKPKDHKGFWCDNTHTTHIDVIDRCPKCISEWKAKCFWGGVVGLAAAIGDWLIPGLGRWIAGY